MRSSRELAVIERDWADDRGKHVATHSVVACIANCIILGSTAVVSLSVQM